MSVAGRLLLLVVAVASVAAAPIGQYTVTASTVVDNRTGLTWQRTVDAGSYTWANALAYCEGLTLASSSSWRLPTRKELHTIADMNAANPAVDEVAFPGTPSVLFWSSTPYLGAMHYSWAVNFADGNSKSDLATALYRVRCVR